MLTIGLPIVSLLIAGGSVAYQYHDVARDARELKDAQAEIQRLSPPSTKKVEIPDTD
jgi:hypothetical protein